MIRPRLELRCDAEIGAEEAATELGNEFFAGAIRPVLRIVSIGVVTGPLIGSQKGPLPLVASGQRA
ncbi:hypothetical protein GCM10023069_01480 [Shinella granuli]